MNRKPSSYIRNHYNELVNECNETGKPIFLTNHGEIELVALSVETYHSMHLDLKIQAAVLEVDQRELCGEARCLTLSDAKQRVLEDFDIAECLLEAKSARADGAVGVLVAEFEESMRNAIASTIEKEVQEKDN